MSYQRLYPQRINWEDEPSLATPINQVNLNKMDSALYGIDGRVVELDENKVDKTETFNTARNGVVPKPTQADITNEKVLRADGVWVEQSGGGGGGGGHIYVDKDDNQMQPRGKAKFTGGLNLTDDSENNRTIVDDNYEIIPWTTWKEYSDAEKAQHPNAIVTGAPDCDGTLEIEVVHLAWTNPNPTSAFPQSGGSNAISLDTDDYDLYYATAVVSGGDYVVSNIVPKGKRIEFSYNQTTPNNYTVAKNRTITYTSDTVLTAGDCLTQPSNGTRSTDNTALVPYQIFTIKFKATAKIKAIAHDVSTDASKCMLDEQHNVKQALTTPYVVSEQTVTSDTTIGSITFKIYSNGTKQVRIANSGVPTSGYTSGYIIPETFRPSVSATVFGVSWGGGNIRPIALVADGRIQVYASANAGLDITATYI